MLKRVLPSRLGGILKGWIMLDVAKLRKQAEEGFVAQMREKVHFVSEKCWVINIRSLPRKR